MLKCKRKFKTQCDFACGKQLKRAFKMKHLLLHHGCKNNSIWFFMLLFLAPSAFGEGGKSVFEVVLLSNLSQQIVVNPCTKRSA